MIVVRLGRPADVDALLALAEKAGPGMTTLKPDRIAQVARLERVQRTIEHTVALCEQGYLFVMEDTASQRVVGVSGLEVAVGMKQPFYTYRIDTNVHGSLALGTWRMSEKLSVSHDLTGATELCTLFLDPDFRGNGNGALLSKSRLMFVAEFRERFGEHICAEMRGHFDENGASPFWDALGAHFYGIGFHEADALIALGKKTFLAELMPRYPVYVDFLPKTARDCIGRTHVDTAPARRLLESEGFRLDKHIDIFEGGPVLQARVDALRVMRESRRYNVETSRSSTRRATAQERFLVSTSSLKDFRVTCLSTETEGDVIPLTSEQADALHVAPGASVRAMKLYPQRNSFEYDDRVDVVVL
ncbi:arginine N-succinyltransferase [Paraburkholderia nemoris]|uniref:arginine N-succinyltransferase n=1 Tax=Paraburkholderia nemoris TaxID=2793076 RepID=UPI0038B910F5